MPAGRQTSVDLLVGAPLATRSAVIGVCNHVEGREFNATLSDSHHGRGSDTAENFHPIEAKSLVPLESKQDSVEPRRTAPCACTRRWSLIVRIFDEALRILRLKLAVL